MNVPSDWTTIVWVRSSFPSTVTLTMSSAPMEYSSGYAAAENGAGAGVGGGVGNGVPLVDGAGALPEAVAGAVSPAGALSPAASFSRMTLATPLKSRGLEREVPE